MFEQSKLRVVSARLSAMLLVGVVGFGSTACKDAWETKIPNAAVSTNPYEDLYRLLQTTKMNWTRIDLTETSVTLHKVLDGGVKTVPIDIAAVDVQLKHHPSKDKWAVNIYKPDGKLLIRLDSPDGNHANELAMAFATVKALIAEGR